MSRLDRRDRDGGISELVYRTLLAAYPGEFRRRYGPQMEQVFRDLCHQERRKGEKTGFVRLWIRTILDLALTAFVQRMSDRDRSNRKEVGVNDYKLAGVGFALLLAPLFFVAASLMKYGLGIGFLFDPLEFFLSEPGRRYVFNLISPIIFLGGLGLAIVVNLYAVLRMDLSREDGTLVSTVRLEVKFANIAVIVVSCALLVTLVGYAFLENFAYRY